jgi:hypothetical protein
MAERLTQFDYLLNAMERAGHQKNPSKAGYAGKRAALYAHVRDLEARVAAGQADADRLAWLAAHAPHEIHITDDGTVTVKRWRQRYTTAFAYAGRTLREAIDWARKA